MGASTPNSGQLPQQVPQQYADGKSFTPSASYEAPSPSLPQILSTIGGLGLNVLGTFKHAGPAGNQALSHGDQIGRDAESAAKSNYSQQKDAEREVKDRDQARALYGRMNELPSAQRTEFEAAAKNGDVARMMHTLDRNESFNRSASTQQRSQDDAFFKQTRADLNNKLGESKFQADLATKGINPQADEMLKEQAFFSSLQNPDKMGMQDLVNRWNLTKGNKQIKDKAGQAALYDRFHTQIVETAQPNGLISDLPGIGPALANTSIAKSLFGTAAPQPFEGYAERQVSKEAVAQHQQSVVAKSAAEQQKQRAYDALHVLNTTKDKAAAAAAAQAVMAGAQEAPALQRIKDAKGNQFDWNPKTGAMTPVKAN